MGYQSFINFPNLMNATRKKKVNPITGLEEPDYINPDNIDFNSVNPSINPQPKQGGGKMAMFANIMNAIAAGTSIGLAQDPAKALQDQLARQAQEAMQRQQNQYELQKQERQYRQQLEIQSRDIGAQNEQLGKKQRFEKEQTEGAQQFETIRDTAKFGNQKELAKIDIDARTAAREMGQQWESTEGVKNRQHQIDMEKLKTSGDIKQIQNRQIMAALLASTKYHQAAPIEKVMKIIDKLNKDLPLDPEDFKVIDTGRRLLSSGGSGGGGNVSNGQPTRKLQTKSTLKTNEAWENDRAELVKSLILQGKQPMVDSNGNIKTDFSGKPVFQYATPEEIARRVQEGVALFDSVRPQIQQSPQNTIVAPQDQAQVVLSNLDKAINSGMSDQDLETAIVSLPSPQLQAQARARLQEKKKKSTSSTSRFSKPGLFVPKF